MRHDCLQNRTHTALSLAANLPTGVLPHLAAVVAIPVRDEVDRIGPCLDALIAQRDGAGRPLPNGAVAVVLLLNNCTDATAQVARDRLARSAMPALIAEIRLPPFQANAGFARGLAMDVAALWLEQAGRPDAGLLTTDADSQVPPDWVDRAGLAFAAGCGAVAGRVRLDPDELAALPAALRQRAALEDDYEAALLQLAARMDPCSRDPWPNHRTASGASFGVTLAAYRAVGGLPDAPCGEDRALARALRCADIPIRHDPHLLVTTSARLDGRAVGGAADTLRERCNNPDGPGDAELETAPGAVRRLIWRRRLRRWHGSGTLGVHAWRSALRLAEPMTPIADTFGAFWDDVEARSPLLVRRALRPSQMPAHGRSVRALLQMLDAPAAATGDASDQDGAWLAQRQTA